MYISNENQLSLKQKHLRHCFPVRIELIFEMKTIWKSELSRWRKSHFVPNWLMQLTWKNTCISEHYLSVTIELVFERILPSIQKLQGWERLILFQIGLFSYIEETNVSLERTPSLWEAGATSTVFPCVSWLRFWKESYMQLRCFKVEIGSLCCK
jgi:hypothetical protein